MSEHGRSSAPGGWPDGLVRGADALLEATVVGSFSRIGFGVRSSLGGWARQGTPTLAGRTVLVTGATSGIGLAAATELAERGAAVRLVGRDEAKAEAAIATIRRAVGGGADLAYDLADMGDLAAVRALAERVAAANPTLDVLVHNAGALSRGFQRAPDGTELTLASHVLGPFLLTTLLLPVLRAAGPARVITMSSGGMYTQRFDLDRLEMAPEGYDGRTAYARAKRAQVVLNAQWARRIPVGDAVFHAMHPGWVDTPGVRSGLPGFHRVMGPLLRTPVQGADTAVWLASDPAALATSGAFWLDRRPRGEHRVPWTRGGDGGEALWELCRRRTQQDR